MNNMNEHQSRKDIDESLKHGLMKDMARLDPYVVVHADLPFIEIGTSKDMSDSSCSRLIPRGLLVVVDHVRKMVERGTAYIYMQKV
jgi:hypothetical protein